MSKPVSSQIRSATEPASGCCGLHTVTISMVPRRWLSSARGFQAGAAELGGIAHGFYIQRNHLGGLVIGEVVDEIGQLQIHLIAGGDQFGQADAARCCAGATGVAASCPPPFIA